MNRIYALTRRTVGAPNSLAREVAIYAHGDRVYLAEGDGDREKPYFICCADHTRLGQLARATLARVQHQVARFVREMGENPWRYMA